MRIALATLTMVALGGCEMPDDNPKTNPAVANQTIGGYTFVYVGTLTENTQFERLVWEITGPDGQKFIAIRGYGVSEVGTESRGKSRVTVER
jgi:hypothetical protein